MKSIPVEKSKGVFFKVLETTEESQVAVMTLKLGEDSGAESVHTGDQIVYIIEGEARVLVSGEEVRVKKGEAAIIPAGAEHRIFNEKKETLFILSLYAPPQY